MLERDMDLRTAVQKVNRRGMLLVFPANNQKEPASMWSEFFPRTEMRWEWDDSGDTRVAELWHLRERLSTSRKVVYTKWYRGRATLISFELFSAMLVVLGTGPGALERAFDPEAEEAGPVGSLPFQSREILDVLEEDSPLSTKALKAATGLKGKEFERTYESSLKALWARLLVVAFGEVDEGAFPSLAIGATKVIFEDLWRESAKVPKDEAWKVINRDLPKGGLFRKYFDSLLPKDESQEPFKSKTVRSPANRAGRGRPKTSSLS